MNELILIAALLSPSPEVTPEQACTLFSLNVVNIREAIDSGVTYLEADELIRTVPEGMEGQQIYRDIALSALNFVKGAISIPTQYIGKASMEFCFEMSQVAPDSKIKF